MHQWLVEVLSPVAAHDCPDRSLMSAVWQAFGVPADLVSFLAEECRLCWKPHAERLEVLDVYMKSGSSITNLSHALLSLWRFLAFCSSRWLTVGVSCRSYVLGMLTGHELLFRQMRASGEIGEYAGGPGDRLDDQSREVAVVLGLMSYVPVSLLQSLMEDSRLLQRFEEVCATMSEEQRYLEVLDMRVWEIGSTCQHLSILMVCHCVTKH
eukprot:6487051-Amphidinium_carterae.1